MDRRRFLLAMAALGLAAPAAQAKTAQGLFIHESPKPVPALDIRDADGQAAGLDALKGRAVLLNLWASWCMPCVAELPALDRLKPAAAAKGVAVVALSLDRGGKIAVVNTFARLSVKALDIRTDEARSAAEKLNATALPVSLLLDNQGREVARYVGAADWEGPKAAQLLDALGAGKPLTPDMAPPLAKLTAAP
ncbi:TlpA family protein disulfide reductase [Paramagnetospirillum kuznetsovii]|uniref:TlpA family protein disulfide reductase n=1 Tax=Paramagnetospirillum kuznetsovii TaxID=2053833 RepID=A0A364NYV9_9PROT|nr:TlpA disulfide reductase family protein [Paramagnetospirillum kuznetsovii]RAU22097.1 TlpA family protein disulfide reductase [Paramagnetospirillum kuznetsovii]